MNVNGKLSRLRLLLSRDRVLGIILGLALGLLFISVLALWMRVLMIFFVAGSFGLILVLPIVFGIVVGLLIVDQWVSIEPKWPTLIILAVILWPTAIYLPFGVHIVRLHVTVPPQIPVYPTSQHEKTTVELGGYETFGDRVHMWFTTETDSSTVLSFYREELLQMGWEEGPEHFIEWKSDGTPYWFSHKTTGRRLHIKVEPMDVDGRTQLEIVFGL